MFVRLCRLVASISLGALAACASGPVSYLESEAIRTSLTSLQTTDPAIQASRFGAYSRMAGKRFIGVWPHDGRLMALSFRWAIPGVVIEEQWQSPQGWHTALQYNATTGKLDVYNLKATGGPLHIREVTVLPDGAVEWPAALMGLEPMSQVSVNEAGEFVRRYPGRPEKLVAREVPPDEYASAVAEARQLEYASQQASSNRTAELLNGMSQALGGAAAQIHEEHEARQWREAKQRSALMQQKSEELKAMDTRLAEQRRDEQRRDEQRRDEQQQVRQRAHITIADTPSQATPPAPARSPSARQQSEKAENSGKGTLEGWRGADCASARKYALSYNAEVVRVEQHDGYCMAMGRRLPGPKSATGNRVIAQ